MLKTSQKNIYVKRIKKFEKMIGGIKIENGRKHVIYSFPEAFCRTVLKENIIKKGKESPRVFVLKTQKKARHSLAIRQKIDL